MASIGTIKYKNSSSWVDILHPIGSVWLSDSSTSPASLFGGTWIQLTDAVLRAATSTGYIGSDTHTLTEVEMPKHYHDVEAKPDGYLFTAIKYVDGDSQIAILSYWGPSLWTGWAGSSAAHSIVQRSYNLFAWIRTA